MFFFSNFRFRWFGQCPKEKSFFLLMSSLKVTMPFANIWRYIYLYPFTTNEKFDEAYVISGAFVSCWHPWNRFLILGKGRGHRWWGKNRECTTCPGIFFSFFLDQFFWTNWECKTCPGIWTFGMFNLLRIYFFSLKSEYWTPESTNLRIVPVFWLNFIYYKGIWCKYEDYRGQRLSIHYLGGLAGKGGQRMRWGGVIANVVFFKL